jgi:hypothetical protein
MYWTLHGPPTAAVAQAPDTRHGLAMKVLGWGTRSPASSHHGYAPAKGETPCQATGCSFGGLRRQDRGAVAPWPTRRPRIHPTPPGTARGTTVTVYVGKCSGSFLHRRSGLPRPLFETYADETSRRRRGSVQCNLIRAPRRGPPRRDRIRLCRAAPPLGGPAARHHRGLPLLVPPRGALPAPCLYLQGRGGLRPSRQAPPHRGLAALRSLQDDALADLERRHGRLPRLCPA